MGNIVLKTWLGQNISAMNDAIVNDMLVQQSGIIKGMTVSYSSGNVLHLTAGYGVIKGRLFESYETDLQAALPASGTLEGRIYLHMDLSALSDPIEIRVYTGETLPALTQDEDCNYDNGIYEIEIATFTAGTVAITDIERTAPDIESILDDMVDDIADLESGKWDNPVILNQTLAVGSTTLTFTNAAITDNANIIILVKDSDAVPESRAQSGNTLTVVFEEQDAALPVRVMII